MAMVALVKGTAISPDITPIKRDLCFYNPTEDGIAPRYETDDRNLKGHRNYEHDIQVVNIHNARGHEKDFNLSLHGFSLHQGLRKERIDFHSATSVNDDYLPLVEDLIRAHIPKVLNVIAFDVTIRHANAKGRNQRPVRKVHIDQSPEGAYLRAEHELKTKPELLEDIRKSRVRFRIVNVWSPINGTVTDHPMVIADSRSVLDTDLVAVQQLSPEYTGETLAVRHNAAQEYWYWSHMSITDALVLQIYDTDGEIVQGKMHSARCAHASFKLSGSKDEPMRRESAEVRCIVVSIK